MKHDNNSMEILEKLIINSTFHFLTNSCIIVFKKAIYYMYSYLDQNIIFLHISRKLLRRRIMFLGKLITLGNVGWGH